MKRRLVVLGVAAAAVAGAVAPSFAQSTAAVSSPVGVSQNSSGTTVVVGRVGVFVGNDGEVCPLVSTQDWQCVNAQP